MVIMTTKTKSELKMWLQIVNMDRLSQLAIPKMMKKRWYNDTFITSRSLALDYSLKKVVLVFIQCSYSSFIKIHWAWQSRLYTPKAVCIFEEILLLSQIF